MSHRIEIDGIGEVPVPSGKLYGAQTQRALSIYSHNPQISLGDYTSFVKAILAIKEASSYANRKSSDIEPELGINIENTCRQLRDNFDKELYPIHSFHSGGGISANMNINEVIANLVNIQFYNMELGTYHPAHPNDNINLNHSTSDCLSSASHIALSVELSTLIESINSLSEQFDWLSHRHGKEKKISRTCMQDAIPITFMDFYSGYTGALKSHLERLKSITEQLKYLNIGGNMIGRAGDCNPNFLPHFYKKISELYNTDFQSTENLILASQNHQVIQALNAELELLTGSLMKVGKDIRLLSSGPNTGLGEITISPVQPGSSAMPGKINPTIPEYLIQCCMQSSGYIHASKMGHTQGELDYNPWIMIVTLNTLDAIKQLSEGINVFWTLCLHSVTPNTSKNEQNITTLIPTIIELKELIGYSETSKIAKAFNFDVTEIRQKINAIQAQK